MQGEEMDQEPDWKSWLREWSSAIYAEDDEALLRSIESGSSVFDGVMSPLTLTKGTKAMVKSSGCIDVDMDTLWAYTTTSHDC